jgi:hypothetical protein
MFNKERPLRASKVVASSIALGILFAAVSAPAVADGEVALAVQNQFVTTFQNTRYQTANVFDAINGPGVRLGAAWLIRSKHGIQGRIMTYVPSAGDPYTLWLVVFNRPSECATTPCSAADIANPAVDASVFNGSGAISASNGLGGGVINFDFARLAGRLPRDLFVLVGDPRGLFRNRGFAAEIHLVVDQHPPIVPGADSWIADLTTTNFPGAGPSFNVAAAIFLACPGASCPASVL